MRPTEAHMGPGRVLTFVVYGDPASQAGMRSVPIKDRHGRVVGSRQITTGGKNLKSWRQEVADVARILADEHGPYTGPVRLVVTFRFPMPSSRLARIRNALIGPRSTKPDLDKLYRAIGDSLTAGALIGDDAKIVVACCRKVEVNDGWTGAAISLSPVRDEGLPSWFPVDTDLPEPPTSTQEQLPV